MELIYFDKYIKKGLFDKLVVAVGQFDGFHLAHMELLNKVKIRAHEINAKTALITFDPHPDFVLKKNLDLTYISPLVDKAKDLLMSLGINDNDLNKYPNELSGGMKMRVSFARAVLKDAPVLLLDEALKELDINSITAICHVIEEEAKKRLVILVTHKVYPDLFGQFNEISLQ